MSTTSASQLNAFAKAAFGGVSYSGAATFYAGLIVGASDGVTGGTEVSSGNYDRVAIINNEVNFVPISDGVVKNDVAFTWPQSTAAWGTINCVRLFDAPSGGNIEFGALLSPPTSISESGITLNIPTRSLTFTVTSNP
jgi:hypothetical protein